MTAADVPTCPLMQAAWYSALMHATGDPAMRDAFIAETGIAIPGAPTTPMEKMIDDATGAKGEYLTAFIRWFNANVWGDLTIQAGKGSEVSA